MFVQFYLKLKNYVENAVNVMDIANQNQYKVILAVRPK